MFHLFSDMVSACGVVPPAEISRAVAKLALMGLVTSFKLSCRESKSHGTCNEIESACLGADESRRRPRQFISLFPWCLVKMYVNLVLHLLHPQKVPGDLFGSYGHGSKPMGYHFGIGAPPVLVYVSGDWDGGTGL